MGLALTTNRVSAQAEAKDRIQSRARVELSV